MTACVRPMFDQSGRWRLEPFTVMGRRRDQSGVRTKQARAALSQAWIVRRTPLTRTVVLLCWTTHHARGSAVGGGLVARVRVAVRAFTTGSNRA
jgi:hypothetical protein